MAPEDTLLEAETRKAIDEKLIAAGWVVQDKKRLNLHESLGVAVREVFDEGNAFCKNITYKVGKKTAEESITNSSGTNLVELQCAAKRGAPWTARNRAFRSPHQVTKKGFIQGGMIESNNLRACN